MSNRQSAAGSFRGSLLPSTTITTAVSAGQTPILGLAAARNIYLEAIFTYGSGGTSADAYVQTSLDGGAMWFDIANFHFLTTTASKLSAVVGEPSTPPTVAQAPTDGSLAVNTVLNGLLGDRFRVKLVTVGTYGGGTTLAVHICTKP